MEVNEVKNKGFNLKKTLTISILGLLFFFILLFIYEYIRITPREVHYSNVTSSSVTVSWNTKSAIPGTVIAKKGTCGFINLFGLGKEKFYDTRDVTKAELAAVKQTSENISKSNDISINMKEIETEVKITDKGKYYTHHIVVKGLEPETEYSFMVGDSMLYRTVTSSDKMESSRTTELAKAITTPEPAYGNIKDAMNTELQFDQLVPVTDAVVILKFVDKLTATSSKPLSGVLNEDGNWYIDISGAMDGGDNPFFDTYDTVDGNLSVELLIDAGNLGLWKKTTSAYILTPASNTVINMPGAITDENMMESVYRVDIKEASVKGVKDDVFATLIIKDEACTLNGLGTWSGSSCKCVAHATLNTSTGVCSCNSDYEKIGGSCVLKTAECKCSCPSGYTTKGCTSDDCDTKNGTCSPTGCETPPKCYKDLCVGCSCSLSCPSTHPLSVKPANYVKGDDTEKTITCNNKNSCGVSCGGQSSLTCYKNTQNKAINGSCGNNKGDYRAEATGWRGTAESNWCGAGVPSNTPTSFLTSNKPNASWTCKGSNGGSNVSCTAKLLGGVATCGGKTAGTDTPNDCTHFNSYSCTDCYYINDFDYACNPVYKKCTSSCSPTTLAALGLDCTKDPNKAPENTTCAGDGKLGQCTFVPSEGCKICTWKEWDGEGKGFSARWAKQTDNTACGDKTTYSAFDCEGFSAPKKECIQSKPAGKWGVDNKCICAPYTTDGNGGCKCTGGKTWDEKQQLCVSEVFTCSDKNKGVDCTNNTYKKMGKCSRDPVGICAVEGISCGNGKKWNNNGECVTPTEPVTTCSISNKGAVCKISSTENGKCSSSPSGTCYQEEKSCSTDNKKIWNDKGECITKSNDCVVGTITPISYTSGMVCTINKELKFIGTECNRLNHKIYEWNYKGYCVFDGDCEVGYTHIEDSCVIDVENDSACWASGRQLYKYEGTKVFKCINSVWSEVINPGSDTQAGYCKTFAATGVKKCSPNGQYCVKSGELYYCKSGEWEDADTITRDDDDIVVDKIASIPSGATCTGVELTGGNKKCSCEAIKDGPWKGMDEGRIVNVGESCIQVYSCDLEGYYEEYNYTGKVCDISGTKCKNNYCGDFPVETGLPKIKADDRKPCSNVKCECEGGADDGESISNGDYCQQVEICRSDDKINKICNQQGWTCNADGLCLGSIENTYISGMKKIGAGQKCHYTEAEIANNLYDDDDEGYCKCTSGIDSSRANISSGQYCRDTTNCSSFYSDCINSGKSESICKSQTTSQVCNFDGNTCSLVGTWKCSGDAPQSLVNSTDSDIYVVRNPLIKLNNFKVSAETNNKNANFIIDSQSGTFVNIQEGAYSFEYKGEQYYFSVDNTLEYTRIFIDLNQNGTFEKDTDLLVSDLASTVKINPIELKYTYRLNEGFNFVSFPFLISDQGYRTAAGLIDKLNKVYNEAIYSISKFDGTWKIVGQNDEIYSNNDFQLIPGQGYVIKAKNSIRMELMGKPIVYEKASDSAPVALFKGWNLIGVYGTNAKQYTAKSMLQDINAYKKVEFSADNVSKWESDVQMYQGFQVTTTDGVESEYGFDYPINTLDSYFVRVQDGTGNWQPELAQ